MSKYEWLKIKYRLTPGNGVALFFLGAAVYFAKYETGQLATSYILWTVIWILLIDLYLQFFITNYKKVLLIESSVFGAIIVLSLFK